MATIKDVAREANVSTGTVSRYLNKQTLKETNKRNIEKAIQKLDYKENMIAKGLKKNKSMTIGVVISNLTDIFSTSIVSSIEHFVEACNYSIVICTFGISAAAISDKIKFLVDRSVDGIVLFRGNRDISDLPEILGASVPLVLADDYLDGFDTVSIDNSNASYRAVDLLIRNGHKDIAIICGTKNSFNSCERYRGFQEAMKDNDLRPNDAYIKWGDFGTRSGFDCMTELLDGETMPSAIYITNYYMTLGALIAINQKNIIVPDDISIVGFDYFESMDVIKPPLTIVEQPVNELGKNIAKIILSRINGDQTDHPEHIMIKTDLIIKKSIKNMKKDRRDHE